jgi:hypothetical protein
MKVGKIRIELAKILTEITELPYSPDSISQANRSQDERSRVNIDPYYWRAKPASKYGAILFSTYTMRAIVEAYKCDNKSIAIRDMEEVIIKTD